MKGGFADYTFIIPARRNSKGLPRKNRILLEKTTNIIPKKLKSKIIISTDDEFIIEKYSNQYNIIKRSEKNSSDVASTQDVLEELIPHIKTKNVIMLYLTYPERTYQDVIEAINFYESNKAKSMLCSKEIKTSPFLMMYKEGYRGKQIVKHNLYRRQDYPECFEISHFICIFSLQELKKLNKNLYNENTLFFPIKEKIDVDTPIDLEKYEKQNKNNSWGWNQS